MTDVSPGGSKIYDYETVDPNVTLDVAQVPEGWREALEAHLEKYLGPSETVFHELISTTVHLDLYIWKPTQERPYHTIVTVGVSDAPLNPPEGAEQFRYVELMMYLPADWPMPEGEDVAEEHYWPFRTIKKLGRFVHEYKTFFAPAHTIPNGDPAEPYASNTKLSGILLTGAFAEPEEFSDFEIDGNPINFLTMIPLHSDEIDLKMEHGAEDLLALMNDNGLLDPVISPKRQSVTDMVDIPDNADAELAELFNLAITNTRREYQAKQRTMGFFEKRRFKPKMPLWIRVSGGGMKDIYKDNAILRDQGKIVWGHIVQANGKLFDPSDSDDCPAAAIYSTDAYYDQNMNELEELASSLFEVKGETTDDPDLQKFADILGDEEAILMKLPIPKSMTSGRDVFYTSIMVHRKQLPVPFLVASAFPLLISSQTEATMILPSSYWSDEMNAYWMLHLKLLMKENGIEN